LGSAAVKVLGRGKKLDRDFTECNRNFDFNAGRAALESNFEVNIGKHSVKRGSLLQTQHLP
jgi:hypothetical protein